MTPEQITAAVAQIVSAQVEATHHNDKPAISETASLHDLGLDELSAVEILMHVEEVFGLELADDDVTLCSTISGIARLVNWHLRNREAREARAASVKEAWSDYPEDAA